MRKQFGSKTEALHAFRQGQERELHNFFEWSSRCSAYWKSCSVSELYYFSGMSYDEIPRELKLSLLAMRNQRIRSVRLLKDK